MDFRPYDISLIRLFIQFWRAENLRLSWLQARAKIGTCLFNLHFLKKFFAYATL